MHFKFAHVLKLESAPGERTHCRIILPVRHLQEVLKSNCRS